MGKKPKAKSEKISTNNSLSSNDQEEAPYPEILGAVPEKIRSKFLAELSVRKGPLPPADDIAKFEVVLPRSADCLFNMAEKNQNHRLG